MNKKDEDRKPKYNDIRNEQQKKRETKNRKKKRKSRVKKFCRRVAPKKREQRFGGLKLENFSLAFAKTATRYLLSRGGIIPEDCLACSAC